jgi:hypothetical protein
MLNFKPVTGNMSSLMDAYQDQRASGRLDLRSGEERGSVFFDFGRPYHAFCGDFSGTAAINYMKNWPAMEFIFDGGQSEVESNTIPDDEVFSQPSPESEFKLSEPLGYKESLSQGGSSLLKGPTRFFVLIGTGTFEILIAYSLLAHMTPGTIIILLPVSIVLLGFACIQFYFAWKYKVS